MDGWLSSLPSFDIPDLRTIRTSVLNHISYMLYYTFCKPQPRISIHRAEPALLSVPDAVPCTSFYDQRRPRCHAWSSDNCSMGLLGDRSADRDAGKAGKHA